MTDILIRNVDEARVAALDELARQAGVSRNEYLLNLINEATGDFDPQLNFGYFKLDRPGDLTPGEVDCPECGQPLDEFWFFIMANHTIGGPICSICATSE